MRKLPNAFGYQRTTKRVLELIVCHDIHHKPPEFRLCDLFVPFHNFNDGRQVVYFLVISKGREYFGEAWFKRGD
jgi:hypothetical protein